MDPYGPCGPRLRTTGIELGPPFVIETSMQLKLQQLFLCMLAFLSAFLHILYQLNGGKQLGVLGSIAYKFSCISVLHILSTKH